MMTNRRLVTTLVTLIANAYMIALCMVPRPQIFTYCIILIELIMLESYVRSGNFKYLIVLPFLSVLTALTIVLGMRMMGAMLISSLVIFPALTAMTLLRSFRGVVICAAGLSVVCFCVGLTGSYLWGTPVGATVVLVNLAAFLLSRGVMKLKRAS